MDVDHNLFLDIKCFTEYRSFQDSPEGFASKTAVFKLDHKVLKFSLKDMQPKKEVTGIFDTGFANDHKNQGIPAFNPRFPLSLTYT